MSQFLKNLLMVSALAFPLSALVACENDEGPFERTGESIDDAADDINDDLDDGMDDLDDDLDDAGDEIEDAVDDVND